MGEIKWTHKGEGVGKRVEIPAYMNEWKAGHKLGLIIERSTYPGTEYACVELDSTGLRGPCGMIILRKRIPVVFADCKILED